MRLNQTLNSIEREINEMYLEEYGITRGQLKEHFDKVRNPEGWKLPIDSTCDTKDIDHVSNAIIFFTGSVPSFKFLGKGKYSVKAAGYYHCQAGRAGSWPFNL